MTFVTLRGPNSEQALPVSVALPGSGTINTSAAVLGESITNPGYQGVNLHIDVTKAAGSAAASPTMVVTVQGLDTVTSGFYNIPDAEFEAFATSTTQETMFIHPMTVSDSGAGFIRTPIMLPSTWRVVSSGGTFASGSSGSSYVFTISGFYVL